MHQIQIIFFADSVLQNIHLNKQINTAIQKSVSENLTGGTIMRNFRKLLGKLITSDEAYSFINTIKRTTKKCTEKVLAGSVSYG